MKVQFLEAAQSEFEEAIDFYNQQSAGLGFDFADEVKKAVERVRNYPEAWSRLSARVRRCLVTRFPFGIMYEVRAEVLIIVAIQHCHREPENWRKRLSA
jgi:toxin ParE1/3/4